MGPVEKLLSDPAWWTKGVLARDERGNRVNAEYGDRRPLSYCLLGALDQSYPDEGAWTRAYQKLCDAIRSRWEQFAHVVEFNDAAGITHEDVMEVVREANV